MTFINELLDIVGMIIMIVMFGTEGHEYADIFMIFLTLVFLFSNSVYVLWGFGVYIKLPSGLKNAFLTAFLGLTSKLRNKIEQSLKKNRRENAPRT